MRMTIGIGAALVLGGCASMNDAGDAGVSAGESANATLQNPAGNAMGSVSLTETATGTTLTIQGVNMPPGSHGFHLHTVGKCEGPDFASAGGHWNPTDKKHGINNPEGPHMGDLPNLIVKADGRGTLSIDMAGARIKDGTMPILDTDGTAIVVHAAADDNVTDPSGNSGARIACGVFKAS